MQEVTAFATGSLSLDTAIGIGGILRGIIPELSCPVGSGKPRVPLNTARILAKSRTKPLYIDIANLLNTSILHAVLGEDEYLKNIVILTPDSAEDAFTMAEMGLESEEFDLIVIDSVGAMASKKEKEVPFEKDTMGQLPKIVARFIKR